MQSTLLLLAIAFGVLVGVFLDTWGVARSAITGAIVAGLLGSLAAVVDGRAEVVGPHLVRMISAVAIPAVAILVIRSYM